LDEQTSKLVAGAWVDPQVARTTVGDWCDTWLAGYSTRRASTVRQANVHIAQILRQFASVRVAAVRPSDVRAWTAKLKAEGLSDSYVYACHNRLSQILEDAVHDGILARNPCSRRTSPPAGKQRPYVATSEQVWALYAAYPDHLKPAILLGAFVGLRTGEAAGLRTIDVDLTAGFIRPAVQHPAEPLKTEMSRTPIPIPADLAQELASYAERYPSASIVSDGFGGQASPWAIERAMRSARRRVHGLPAEFRFHDLRHYFASLLIAAGCDIKTVQTRVRHGSAKTTLDTYGHLFPDADESTRAAVSAALAVRMDSRSGRADERLANGSAYQ
jgi:integrase